MAKETILVVDDEKNIVKLAKLYLEKEGYRVEDAYDGSEALAKIKSLQPALVVLDLMLPEIDGWEVCRRARRESDVPIIMLTARDDDVDKIVGLELGADDYLTKPFNPRELVARVRAVLRRYEKASRPGQVIKIGQVTIDPQRREVTVGDRLIELRTQEFDLLLALAQHKGIVLSRDQLLDLAWGFDFYGQTRTVDIHIAHLRDKLAGSDLVVDELLDLARIESGQIQMLREPVDLAQILEACVEKFALRARESNVELVLDVPALPLVTGDKDRLDQVFTNLLANALKHTPPAGKVMVKAREVKKMRKKVGLASTVEISVTDTGTGIPPEDLSHIFERFYQVDKSRAGQDRGAGLGLTIARQIVEAHEGSISVESVRDLGTKFTVSLPVVKRSY